MADFSYMAGPFSVPAPPGRGPIDPLFGLPFTPSFSKFQPDPMDSTTSLSPSPTTLSSMTSSATSSVVALSEILSNPPPFSPLESVDSMLTVSPTSDSATQGGPALATSAPSTSLISIPSPTFLLAWPQPTTKLLTITMPATTANKTVTTQVTVAVTTASISTVTLPLSSSATSAENFTTPLPSASAVDDPLDSITTITHISQIAIGLVFGILFLTAAS
ncbi:hypothetical protein PV05_10112 [Exophiala xenobiotica]|uniref:Uncharacterized protein n=1 Tax=Exophiala xenobiotica TaxID=348802 RepID=A0A0D2E9Q7_9EURO|nr:uncharacterized protein PV05_10112 [Exophiala xenobiotica]KIW51385.1 hypothetical protein PV05_10112 [Exophiala xenobiotica]